MTKTKRFSRIITFALAMLMVVAMAVPAFAAQPGVNTTFTLGGNRVTANGAYGNAGVTLSGINGSTSQYWILQKDLTGNYRLYTALNSARGGGFTMNRHSNGTSCIIWKDATDNATLNDSVEDLLTVSSGVQRISLARSTSIYKNLNTSGNYMVWTTSGAAFGVNPA